MVAEIYAIPIVIAPLPAASVSAFQILLSKWHLRHVSKKLRTPIYGQNRIFLNSWCWVTALDMFRSVLFISYAHSDGSEIASWLARALKAEGFDVWWDMQRLLPGASWTLGIETAIDRTDIVLALLSRGSYCSDICRAEQLRALRKGKRVLPVAIQRDVDLPIHLESEQYLAFDTTDYNHGLAQLKAAIANETFSAALVPKYRTRYLTYPPLPDHFVSRPELTKSLRQGIIKEQSDRSMALIAIRGMGGIGKTVLAQAICHDEAVQDAFPDGVMWVTIGEKPSRDHLRVQMRELAKALGEDLERYDSFSACENQLRNCLRSKSALIVLDDVWDPRHVGYFAADAPRCRLLVTTRSQVVVRGTGAWEFPMPVMRRNESLELLARKSGLSVAQLPGEAGEIDKECGSLPLALAMLGSRAGRNLMEWRRTLEALKRGQTETVSHKLAGYRYAGLFEATRVSVESLKPLHRSRYLDLAIFRTDISIPKAVLKTLWSTDEYDAADTIEAWVEASLAGYNAQGDVTVHDLQLDYVHSQAKDLKALHLKLVSAYKKARRNGWESGLNDGYYFSRLAYHLHEAGELGELRMLLLNPQWIRARLEDRNIDGLIADFDFLSSDPDLRRVQSALRLSANVLAHDPKQLASQLFGRLRSPTNPRIEGFLEAIRRSQRLPWVEPLWTGLWRPGRLLLFTLAGHSLAVNAIAVTPDGRRAVSASDDTTLRLWDIEKGLELRTLSGHSDSVQCVAITPDGQHAISASRDKTLRVWNLDSGETIHVLLGHTGWVDSVILTPDGQNAISGSRDHTLRVWNLSTGEEVHTLAGHSGAVNAIAATPGKPWVVSASDDCTLRIWHVESGQEIRTLYGHTGPVNDVKILLDGKRVVSASSDKKLKIWDLESGAKLQTLSGHSGWLWTIVLSPNNRQIISASSDSTLRVWDSESGAELHTLTGHSQWITSVIVARDGNLLISGSSEGTVKIWGLATGTELRTLIAHSGALNAIVMTQDGTRVISASDDCTVRVWRTDAEARDLRFPGSHDYPIKSLAVTANGRRVVSASHDKTLKVWDLESGAQIHVLCGHLGPINTVALTPDSRTALSASDDRTLKLWDLETGLEIYTLSGHTGPVVHVLITPDGTRAISASHDSTFRVWDLRSGKHLYTFLNTDRPTPTVSDSSPSVWNADTRMGLNSFNSPVCLTPMAITPDGRYAVSAYCSRTVKMLDLQQGTEIRSLVGHEDCVDAIAIGVDAPIAVTASLDKTLRVWSLHDGAGKQTLAGHAGAVNCVALSSGAKFVLSSSTDLTLKLWELESGAAVHTMRGHTGLANAVAMCPSENCMISISDDTTLRIWNQAADNIATFSADGALLCFAFCKEKNLLVAGDFLGCIHLLRFHDMKFR